MTRQSKPEHVRLRYGMCLNDNCSKCKSKEVQSISARKEFVCEECGKPLRECPPPAKSNKAKTIAIVAAAAVIIGGGAFFIPQMSEPQETQQPAPVPETQTPQPEAQMPEPEPQVTEPEVQTPEPEPQVTQTPQAPLNGRGTVDLGYATYTGDLKNGKPHGYGTLIYKASRKIVPSKDFTANPGDTYEGEFRNGKVSGGIGYWTHNGNKTAIQP